MKIAIIGAGAMGCLYGAHLSQAHEIYMLDTLPSQVSVINSEGISVENPEGDTCHYPQVKAFLSGQCHEVMDMVIIFVKAIYSDAALQANQNLFGEKTIVMTLQNGAGHDRKIARYVTDPKQIVLGNTTDNAVNLGNGRIRHSGYGITNLGSNHQMQELVTTAAQALRDGGFKVNEANDIQRIIWNKLFVNLSINAFTTITQTPIGYVPQNEYGWDFAKRLIYEAVDVAEADGTYFERREVLQMVKEVCEQMGNGYSSMYQDRKRHIKTEVDTINGAVVEQAKRYGIATPYNTIVIDLIHAIEGAYELQD